MPKIKKLYVEVERKLNQQIRTQLVWNSGASVWKAKVQNELLLLRDAAKNHTYLDTFTAKREKSMLCVQ